MKTGVIVYVTGSDLMNDIDTKDALKEMDYKPDRVEVVFGNSNAFDVMDAWWRLIAKGMARVVCIFAEVSESSGLKFTGRQLRLCG
ncbi:MAG: hypothetical protein J7J52_05975 [Deltaproteobacteria bacterium]|nr:hypothetical protein [Deltaproteobacteria bacterium]